MSVCLSNLSVSVNPHVRPSCCLFISSYLFNSVCYISVGDKFGPCLTIRPVSGCGGGKKHTTLLWDDFELSSKATGREYIIFTERAFKIWTEVVPTQDSSYLRCSPKKVKPFKYSFASLCLSHCNTVSQKKHIKMSTVLHSKTSG